jgi:hypothetical protein
MLAAVWVSGCTGARARTVPPVPANSAGRAEPLANPAAGSTTRTSTFITTFWCGPPFPLFDDARAEQIVAAGFTVVGPPCEDGFPFTAEAARGALDTAARHGLKVWVQDPRFGPQARRRADWESTIAAAVADYASHPGFGGYFVSDEPVVTQFDDLAAIVARLRALDPDHLAYINLLPDYAIRGAGASSYAEYVERFLATVSPRLLSYDYYGLTTAGDRRTFFSSLSIIREQALKSEVPFMLIFLAMPHANYRDPTEAELSWQAMHALAYGARGVSYFAYWTPVNVMYQDVMKFRHGLIEQGKPTRHYAEAAALNRTVRSLAASLEEFRSVAVADSRGEVAPNLPAGPIEAIEDGAVTVGLFAGEQGRQAALLVNRDYKQDATITVRMREGEERPDRFDVDTNTWRRQSGKLKIEAGQAVLLRWTSPASSAQPTP